MSSSGTPESKVIQIATIGFPFNGKNIDMRLVALRDDGALFMRKLGPDTTSPWEAIDPPVDGKNIIGKR